MSIQKHYCKYCNHQSKNASDYAKHIKGKKHLKAEQDYKEDNDVEKLKLRIKQLELELELEKTKNGGYSHTPNITINNIDNSHNTVNNVFVFNTENRMNFNDFIETIPDALSIYNCGEFDGIGTIQRQFLRLDRHERPVMIKANDMLVKNNDEEFTGAEARKVINKELHKVFGKWVEQNEMPPAGACDADGIRFCKICEGCGKLNIDEFMRKIKCELTYKETDK